MEKLIVLILILLSFLSCNSNPKEESQEVVRNDTLIEKLEKDVELAMEPEPDVEILDTIKNHCLGNICAGEPIKNILPQLKENFKVLYDSIAQSELDTLYFYYYTISDKNNKRLYELTTVGNLKEHDTVNTIMIYSNQFITEKGIRLGSKLNELKSKYTFEKAYFTYDEGLWLYFADFNGGFRLHFNAKGIEDFDYENPDLSIDSIPEQIKVDGIVLYNLEKGGNNAYNLIWGNE